MKSEQSKAIVYVPEPELVFGHGQTAIDPRDGLTLFGPFTRSSVVGGRIGIVGTTEGVSRMISWLTNIQKPVYSLDKDIARPFFPGFEAAFEVPLNLHSIVPVMIEDSTISNFLRYEDSHQRIHNLASLYADELIKFKTQEEIPVVVWLVVIPDEIYLYGRPQSKIPRSASNVKTGIKDKYSRTAPLLFEEFTELQEAYKYELNFHNQLKIKVLHQGIVTQIVRETTIAFKDFKDKYGRPTRDLSKFESAIAWNISTTLYYKLGGTPWKLSGVRDMVCYIGLVYKRIDASSDGRMACCAAQMFLDSGDGLVFRAANGRWFDEETKQFHLSEDAAFELLDKAILTYQSKNAGHPPKQIFIHAKTFFNEIEWNGFLKAADGKSKIIGVRIRADNNFKLYRDYKYPAPRGVVFATDKTKAFLWTKGFIPKIETVVGLETPNPLSIEITKGDEDIITVCKDVLMLTKLNYNACTYGDGLPVTLRFADSIGEVITAGPIPDIAVLPFKHYI